MHGFTSPLGVLVPLLADAVHPGWGLPFIKLVSALVSIPTVLLAAAIALHRAFRVNIWLVYLLCGYLALEHHQILWGMAGMETQIAVFTLFLAMYHALQRNARALGVAMALCVGARPDFVIFLAFVALYLLLTDWKVLRTSLPLALALYAPWAVFTTLYYGSPVPNTIVAKWLGYDLWTRHVPILSQAGLETIWLRAGYIFIPLGPFYGGHGAGFQRFIDEGVVSRVALVAMLLGAAAMLHRFHRFYIVVLGGVAAFSFYYIFFVHHMFGWYLVPFSALAWLLLTLGMGAIVNQVVLPSRMNLVGGVACVGFLLPFLIVLPVTFRADRNVQRYIEPLRRDIGLYLRDHKKPGDRVGCEPLGNIAYYSGMPVYDYPGLANAAVTGFLKNNPQRRNMRSMLAHFQPEWIVLRPQEYEKLLAFPEMRFLETGYTMEKVFRADPAGVAQVFRAGNNIDQCFFLLKKRG